MSGWLWAALAVLVVASAAAVISIRKSPARSRRLTLLAAAVLGVAAIAGVVLMVGDVTGPDGGSCGSAVHVRDQRGSYLNGIPECVSAADQHQMIGRIVIGFAVVGALVLLSAVLISSRKNVNLPWLNAAPAWEVLTVCGVALCGIVVVSSGFFVVTGLLSVG